MTPALSVVIPTLGRRPEELRRALAHLTRQSEPDFEVVLALDAAAGDVDARAGGLPHTIERARRPGASAARNAGWRAARAPIVLFPADDILASPGLVGEHLAAHRADPRMSAATLGLVRWAGELPLSVFMRWLDRGVQFQYPFLRDGTDVGWGNLFTANASVKREALDAVGGFDEENFPFGYEDLDLARRLHDALGLTVVLRRAAWAEHLHRPRLEEWRTRVARIAVCERRFVELHPDVRPYFHDRFRAAMAGPAPRGRGARLARWIGPGVPWIGPRVWASVDARYTRELAPPFLEAWAAASGSDRPE